MSNTSYLGRMIKASSRAIDALRKMREGRNATKRVDRKRVKPEMSSLFQSKRPKIKSSGWQHKFFCLAFTGQDKSTTCEAEKDELFRASLGERDIVFEDVNISQEEFHAIIIDNFPRLQEGGGIRFLEGVIWNTVFFTPVVTDFVCPTIGLPNSRYLEVLSMSVRKSLLLALKQSVGLSRTYTRPLQRELDLTPLSDEDVVCICVTGVGIAVPMY